MMIGVIIVLGSHWKLGVYMKKIKVASYDFIYYYYIIIYLY